MPIYFTLTEAPFCSFQSMESSVKIPPIEAIVGKKDAKKKSRQKSALRCYKALCYLVLNYALN